MRRVSLNAAGRDHRYEILNADPISGFDALTPTLDELQNGGWGIESGQYRKTGQGITISCPPKAGVYPYRLRFKAGEYQPELTGVFVRTEWEIAVFPWKIDPREDPEGWRAEAITKNARTIQHNQLRFRFGHGGLLDIGMFKKSDTGSDNAIDPGNDHFGMIATTTLPIPAGEWRIKVLSDDGVRVLVDGEPIVTNWTWHGPTRDDGVFTITEDHTVTIVVEYFEIDGYSVLEFDIEQVE